MKGITNILLKIMILLFIQPALFSQQQEPAQDDSKIDKIVEEMLLALKQKTLTREEIQFLTRDRKREKEDVKKLRTKLIYELMEIVQKEKLNFCFENYDGDAKSLSIELLGELRAEEAIDLLINNLLYDIPTCVEAGEIPLSPAGRALAKIDGLKVWDRFRERIKDKRIEDCIEICLEGIEDRYKDFSPEEREEYIKNTYRLPGRDDFFILGYSGYVVLNALSNYGADLLKAEIDREREKGYTTYLRNLRMIADMWQGSLDEYYWRDAHYHSLKRWRESCRGTYKKAIESWMEQLNDIVKRTITEYDKKDPIFYFLTTEIIRGISDITKEEYIPGLYDDEKMKHYEFTKEELQEILKKAQKWWNEYQKSPEYFKEHHLKWLEENIKIYLGEIGGSIAKEKVIETIQRASKFMGQELIEGIFDTQKITQRELTREELLSAIERAKKWYEEQLQKQKNESENK